jgi:dienelactone hydrolase
MRNGIEVRLGAGDRKRHEAIVGSGSSAQKHVWRARIVLLRLAFRISLLAIGLPSLFATTASAGSLVEFANLSERGPAILLGYLARPDQGLSLLLSPGAQGPEQYPAVVVLHGCDGLSSHIARIADRLGSWGYVALAVDSLGARGFASRCASVSLDQAFDAYAALRYLAQQDFVDPTRIAILGQSMGGYSTLYAVDRDMLAQYFAERFRAAVAYYPACSVVPLPTFTAPVLILIGEADDWTPADRCREMVAHARPDSTPITLHVYPDAHHAFDIDVLKPGRSVLGHWVEYNELAAKDAEEKTRAFLAAYLAGTSPATGNRP